MTTVTSAAERLKERFADAVQEVSEAGGEVTVHVSREWLVEICRLLKSDADLCYNMLIDMAGVDYLRREPRFEAVYHLYSIPHNGRLRLKVRVPESAP